MRRRTTWSNPILDVYIGPAPINPAPLVEALRLIRDGEAHRDTGSLAEAYDRCRQLASHAIGDTMTMPLCRTCGGQRWIVAHPEPAHSFGTLSCEELDIRAARRREAPRIPCPRGCEPWPWDRERLAADAIRLQQKQAA